MSDRTTVPTIIKKFLGINDSSSPLIKDKELSDVLDNFELSQDFALNTRRGSVLFDYGSRLREFANCAFVADEYIGISGDLTAGTRYYVGRFYDPENDVYSLPTRTVECVVANNNAAALVQILLTNNPDRTVYTQFKLYRTEENADPYEDPYYPVATFDEAAAEAVVIYSDGLLDGTLANGTPLYLNDTGLGVDHPVVSIIDYERNIGGRDILYAAGAYIKSTERGDKIYETLVPDRFGSYVVAQNAVFYVNGKNFLMINDNHEVFPMGGDAPNVAPSVTRVSGPLTGAYRWVETFYDDGSVTKHPWESNPSEVSAILNLEDGGAHIQFNDTNAPERATHRKLYRTLSNGAIEEALLVDTIPIAETDTYDTNSDTVIGPDIAPFDKNDNISDLNIEFIFKRNDRLYGAGNIESPGSFYWSQRGSLEQWSEIYNRVSIESGSVRGFGESDGVLIVFFDNAIYIAPDDPPNQVYKLGFEQGAINFRSVCPGENGIFTASENSIYQFKGNVLDDIADYIANFIEFYSDSTISTLKMGQIVSYKLPTKKQIIVLFKTMDQGFVNSIVKVYHPYVGKQVQDQNTGWTTFKDFKATTVAAVKNSFNRDMLLLGGEDGNVYCHDRVTGQDRAKYLNFGAQGAPFVGPSLDVDTAEFDDPFDDLDNWSVTGSGTGEIAPAGFLHIENIEPAINTVAQIAKKIDLVTGVRVLLDTINFVALPTGDTGAGGALIIEINIKKDEEAGTDERTRVRLGIFKDGFYGDNLDGVGFVKLVDFTFSLGTDYDIEFIITPGNSTASPNMKYAAVSVDGQYINLGVVWGASTTDNTVTDIALRTQAYNGKLEFTLSRILVAGLSNTTYGDIEQFVPGEAISYVYESPWLALDDVDDTQKFLKRVALVVKANANTSIRCTVFSDMVEDDGSVTEIPISGGTLWDIAVYNKSKWDGFRQTVSNRGATNRVGKHFKLRLECDTYGVYFELYSITLRKVEKESGDLVVPRANENVNENAQA